MDRREALRKLATGGSVAFAAPIVLSAPVSASGSDPNSGGPSGGALVTPPPASFALPGGDKKAAQWTFTAAAIGCGTGTVRVDSYVTGFATANNGTNTVTFSPSASTYVANTPTVSVRADDGQGGFKVGDTVEFTWYARFVCLEGGVPVSVACRNYTYRFVNQANGNPVWVASAGTPTVATPACSVPSS